MGMASHVEDGRRVQRGGRTIYAGPLGKESRDLVAYFQAIEGVPPIKGNINPATWMLEVSTPGMEERLHVDFADIYEKSDVFRCAPPPLRGRRRDLVAALT